MGKEKFAGVTNYIIYGSEEALQLFEESLDTLIASDTSDFDVVRCTPDTPVTSLLDDFVLYERFLFIDERTYKLLHENLCHKIHKIVGHPVRDSRLGPT